MSLQNGLSREAWVYLEADPRLTQKECMEIAAYAMHMHVRGENERCVRGIRYEGHISTNGEYQNLLSFYGKRFDADLYVRGCDVIHVSFLLNETTFGPQPSTN